MSGIQILLTGGLLALFLYFIARFRNALASMLIVGSLLCLAVFFVLFPAYTTRIAHAMGVGRGTDLLLYIAVVFFLFLYLKLVVRVRRLETDLTTLVREMAIQSATHLQRTTAEPLSTSATD